MPAERHRRLTVLVVFGSRSVEHEVSIVTAVQAMDAMDPRRYDVLPVLITKDGRWVSSPYLRSAAAYRDIDALIARASRVYLRPEPDDRRLHFVEHGILGVPRVRSVYFDCLFPIVHGTFGEDGTLQGVCELANIPYVGPGVAASAVGMDKILMKSIFRDHGLPITRFRSFTRTRWEQHREDVLDELETALEYPLYVKPSNLGSSVGITSARTRDELAVSIDIASAFDQRLLAEEGVANVREINCSVLGNADECHMSECEEPVRWSDFLSYEDKYMQSNRSTTGSGGMADAKRRIPADITPEQTTRIKALAADAFRAIDCAGVARVDFLMNDTDGTIYVNEINTTPGSLSFYLWEASGLTYPKLVDALIELALERHRQRRSTTRTLKSRLLEQFATVGAKGKVKS
jgi:D-alanine-D-alanine ligase